MSPAGAGRRLTLAALILLAATLLGPPFLNVGRFKGRMVHAMEESLGRPVTVDEVSLRLLPRPGFDMRNLVVGDDPRFSAEPLLRAEEVTASLRLSSLWRGRMEISRLSLSYPSLNLVRAPDGRWNLDDLRLRAAQMPSAPTGRTRPEGRPRFPYIEADSGRVNLKLGAQKTVFTLSEADFAVWLESEEELGLRLSARPVRTDANLADTGELRVSGTLGRTASLDQAPIKLSVSLEEAQLGQVSTLIYGRDRGWRGGLQVRLAMAGLPSDLALSGSLRLQDFRRYDIVGGEGLRMEATCSGTYRAPADALGAIECHVPSGDGEISVRGAIAGLFGARRYDLSIAARELPMATVTQVVRRARRNLPDDLTATGSMNAAFTARTLDLNSGRALAWAGGGSTSGFRLRSVLLDPELVLGEVKFAVEQEREPNSRATKRPSRTGGTATARMIPPPPQLRLTWAPFAVALGGPASATARATLDRNGYRAELHGEAAVSRLLQVARVAGVNAPATGVEGAARLNLVAAGAWKGFAAPVLTGSAQLRKVRAQFEGIASPVEITAATVALSEADWSVRDLSVSLPAARLHFAGSLSRERTCTPADSCLLSFTLQIPELSTDDLNRLLNPRLQEPKSSWFTLGSGRSTRPRSVLRELHAEGRLMVGRLLLKSLGATQVTARAHLAGGRLVLADVLGEALGGRHRGSWRADFTGPEPVYSGKGSLEDASMEQLARLMRDPWATGSVNAEYDAVLRGWTATELAANAAGSARFTWKNGSLNRALLPGAAVPLRVRRFSGQLSVRESKLTIPEARLESPAGEFTVSGSASFSRQLDLRVARGASRAFAVTGTLAAPQVAAIPLPQTEAALR
ncbi:MAG: AsmA family protein [Acidobacteria bacterium]|nr:AsmA family protein [Acidobacteriota bacterium]